MEEFEGLPGISEYLAARGDGHLVDAAELDHIAEALVAYCGFTKEQSERILSLFFQEIRSCMLKGESVDIRGFGTFNISSPSTTSNSRKVFPKFKAKRSLTKRMNNDSE